MLKTWSKSWVISFTFQAYTLPHTLNCICVSLFKFHTWILKYFLHCPKRPALPRHIKEYVSFELFGALYMYISVDSWICGAMIAGFWCWFIDLSMQLFISVLFEGGSLSILTILIDYLCKGSLSKGLCITSGLTKTNWRFYLVQQIIINQQTS